MKINFDNYSIDTKNGKCIDKFINRDMSWLEFNRRVMQCSLDKNIPINERLKFLAISSTNLDEFISVRYSENLDEKKQIRNHLLKSIKEMMREQFSIFKKLNIELTDYGYEFIHAKDIKNKDKARKIFLEKIFPVLSIINISNTSDIPRFYNGQNVVSAIVKSNDTESIIMIPIHESINKCYIIGKKIVMVDDLIVTFINEIFVNKNITETASFRVFKNSNISINHDTSEFILDRMQGTLDARNASPPMILLIKHSNIRVRKMLQSLFNIKDRHMLSNIITDFSPLSKINMGEKYLYKPFIPNDYKVTDNSISIFDDILEKDILLHHPFDTYNTVVKFIEHAALDDNVVAIKQTLYRVSSYDSPIVNALCEAANRGKSVSVLLEIKARFDEERNISLINKLEKSGVHVSLGLEYLKTHCKLCIVVRNNPTNDDIEIFSHIATGNYNEKTSKIYTDISYFTAKNKVGQDLLQVFNILSGLSTPDEKLQRVFYAPITLRKKLEKNIDREISFAKKGKKASITLKLNSLSDIGIANKLYEAASHGVKINIICRGVCSIVPRKNIYIKSVVGRFLEHSRIYYFRNNNNPEYYISSSDLLSRNLDRRVEVMVPITSYQCINKIEKILYLYLNDKRNSFESGEDGLYRKLDGDFDVHQYLINNSGINIPKKKKK